LKEATYNNIINGSVFDFFYHINVVNKFSTSFQQLNEFYLYISCLKVALIELGRIPIVGVHPGEIL